MNILEIKVFIFDIGGMILDWYCGFKMVFEIVGIYYGLDCDWLELIIEFRWCFM